MRINIGGGESSEVEDSINASIKTQWMWALVAQT